MDSFGLHFERMSNLDLHPLSLPISRLSPAKSTSSIADQLPHHQHGKGDSAYSSFSGGSTVPDYPSPFLQDDLQPSAFNHYTDLKYVKAVYQPCQAHQSETRTMDQLYHSVEAISQQHRNINSRRQNGHDRCQADSKLTASPNPPSSLPPAPPPPARMDSLVATRNLENSRGHHQGTKPPPQPLRTRTQQTPFSHFHPLTLPQDSLKSNHTADPGPGDPDLVFGGWRETQQEPPQSHQPPSYRPPPQRHDVVNFSNSEHIIPAHQCKLGQQQISASLLNKSPAQVTNQMENQKNKQRTRSSDLPNKGSNNFDRYRKRAHSAKESSQSLVPEPDRSSSPSSIGQNLSASSSSQHKGQFYFVTGRQTGTGGRKLSVSSCASEAGSESSTVVETFTLREKERCHSTMDNFFRPTQHRPYKSTEALSDKMPVYPPMSQEQDSVFESQDENLSTTFNGPYPMTTQPSHTFDSLEQMYLIQCQEMGRHTANHPIFFCGPEESHTLKGNQTPAKGAAKMISNDQLNFCKRENLAKKGRRQPLGDVASERINKETTPLLYHLTGASRAALKPKKDIFIDAKVEETTFNKAGHKDINTRSKERSLPIEAVAEVGGEVISNACNALDDSFKKYYKEQLKDAQSKVLRETSFKRKDLQLSLPHRINEKRLELRPSVMHHFSASQDSETSTETLTPSITSGKIEVGSIKKEVMEKEKDEEGQRENARPLNVAQPQVARIGNRKRLTQEQKKMCFSEPEKLHQLGDSSYHSSCSSLGNELEHFISTECLATQEPGQHGEQGFVAARRKIFEIRGRAFSASNLSKTNLKNLQHKALVEYVERKTGHKVAEPQQPGAQLPPPPRQRHSVGEKPVGWAGKSPASAGGQGFKKKLNRPHSAGRILDSSSSSIRYAQFFSAQQAHSGLVQGSGQPSMKDCQSAQGKSASVESLLSQTEHTDLFRNRSRSIPYAFQAHGPEDDSSPADAMETQRSEPGRVAEEPVARPAMGVQQRVRVVAQRGKSMEELGTMKCSRPAVLSKSSEQLEQLWDPTARPGRENRSLPSVLDDGRLDETAHIQGLEQARQRMETLGLERTQPQQWTHKRTPSKAGSDQQLGVDEESGPAAEPQAKSLSSSASPASSNFSGVRIPSGTPSSHGPVRDESRLSLPGSEPSDPQSPNGPETRERDLESTLASPPMLSQPRSLRESKPGSRDGQSTSGSASHPARPAAEPHPVAPQPDPTQEDFISGRVSTEPELPTPPLPPPVVHEESHDAPLSDRVLQSCSKSPSLGTPALNAAPHQPPSHGVSQTQPVPAVDGEARTETTGTADPEGGPTPEVEEPGVQQGEGWEQPPAGRPGWEQPPAGRPGWAELVVAVVKADRSLAKALYPLAQRKTALMLMEQLLSEDTLLMEEHYKKKQEQRAPAQSSAEVQPLSALDDDDNYVPSSDPQVQADITEKKRVLVAYAEEVLRGLEGAQGALQAEVQENAARGEEVLALVRQRCRPLEVERYSLFIGDLQRVVSLLLCLSARLARVQNALSTVDLHTDAEEKESLDSRHRLLCKQRDDAKDLKDNLDRRESVVSAFLAPQLSGAQLGGYRRFVQTTASLLIRQKDLEERRQLAEEQAEALRSSLPPGP